jgi:hypothetical protein
MAAMLKIYLLLLLLRVPSVFLYFLAIFATIASSSSSSRSVAATVFCFVFFFCRIMALCCWDEASSDYERLTSLKWRAMSLGKFGSKVELLISFYQPLNHFVALLLRHQSVRLSIFNLVDPIASYCIISFYTRHISSISAAAINRRER